MTAAGAPDELLRHWAIPPAAAHRIGEGEVKAGWLVDRPRSVLQVYPASVPLAAVEQEVAWTEALRPVVPEIPEPIVSQRGRLVESAADGSAAVLRRLVDGHPPDGTAETRASMAGVLARIHREAARLNLQGRAWFPPLRDFDRTANPWWDLEPVSGLERTYPEIGEARRQLDQLPEVFRRFEGLPECLVHNDFHRGNLIARGSEIVGVIDWDWATIDWRVLDVAAGMRSWMLRPDRAGYADAVDFVDRYSRTVGDFGPDERRLLPDVLLLRSLWTVFYDVGRALDNRLQPDDLRYRLVHHRQLEDAVPGVRVALEPHFPKSSYGRPARPTSTGAVSTTPSDTAPPS